MNMGGGGVTRKVLVQGIDRKSEASPAPFAENLDWSWVWLRALPEAKAGE